MAVFAYKYALREPLNWGDDCLNQMKLANELWNALVGVEHHHTEARHSIINDPPELARLNDEIKLLQEQVAALVEEKKQRNKVARKKTDTAILDARVRELKARLKPLYEEAKTARKASVIANKALLDARTAERYAEVKQARQAAASDGLWWGNYNAVMASFDAAVSRTYKEGGELRTKRFNGEGRLANQIQDGISVEDLLDGKCTRIRLVDEPWDHKGKGQQVRQDKQRYHLEFCAYANGRQKRMVRFPIVFHRPLPEKALIKQVTVKRIREFDRWKWFVVFTIDTQEKVQLPTYCRDEAVVNFGWRKTEDGIRIATVLRNGHIDYILYPHHLYEGQLAGEHNHGEMDAATNRQVAWLKQLPLKRAPEHLQEIVSTILGYKRVGGGQFEWLRRTWEIEARHWQPELLKELQAYGADWRLYSRTAAAQRRWVDDARLYFYRSEVRRLFQGVGRVVVNAHDMSATAERESSTLPREVQHQRFLTAPSVLRGALVEYMTKIGMVKVVDETAHDVCACHGLPFVRPDRQKLNWDCPVDGRVLDQDDNFCHIMFQRNLIGKLAA
jgi:hypothetical protein